MQALVHRRWDCLVNCGDLVEKYYFVPENLLNLMTLLYSVSVEVPMETLFYESPSETGSQNNKLMIYVQIIENRF